MAVVDPAGWSAILATFLVVLPMYMVPGPGHAPDMEVTLAATVGYGRAME
jgi:hypothetical protein